MGSRVPLHVASKENVGTWCLVRHNLREVGPVELDLGLVLVEPYCSTASLVVYSTERYLRLGT
jgi:hypothetical protein